MEADKDKPYDHTQQLYARFMNLAINRFQWDGLPLGLDSRIMETKLITHGMLGAFMDSAVGLLILPCSGVSNYNVYGEPMEYTVYGHNYTRNIKADDIIIIRNNAMGVGDSEDLQLFAERINEIEQTKDVNLVQQNTPFIFLTDEKERLTFKNMFKQIKEHRYAIFGSKGLAMNKPEALQTTAPYLLDKLQIDKTALMNELLTFLGINNSDTEKKERLLVDEVNANNDFILVNIDHMYDEREKAVEEINKKFGVQIKVEKREVILNGSLHDNINGTDRDGAENI